MKKAFTLAEVGTHIAMSSKKQSFGFTLAEVLITLGIIGVVAAITMPTLIQNYKKQVYVNQLKKTVSMLEQGFQKMMADEGVEKLTDLSYWDEQHYYNAWTRDGDAASIVNDILTNGFKVNFNKVDNYSQYIANAVGSYADREDGYNNLIQFADSSAMVATQLWYTGDNSRIADFIIDVNGPKGPNKAGRDLFIFILSNKGKLSTPSWFGCSDSDENDRLGCAKRIIENGWKMDY